MVRLSRPKEKYSGLEERWSRSNTGLERDGPAPIHALGDAQPHTMASRSSHGTWVKAFCSLVAQLPTRIETQFAWIKPHTGFKCNECSDLFSTWITYSSFSSPEFLPPPPIGIVSNGVLPVCHRLTTSISRSLIPRHYHQNIHVASSLYYYNQSSWFSGLPFKWSSGNMNFSKRTTMISPHARVTNALFHSLLM